MAIIKNTTSKGTSSAQTLSGDIELNEGLGELTVRRNGKTLTQVNSQGFTYSDENGTKRIHVGAHPADGHVGIWVSKPGIDVMELLKSGG